MFYSHEIGCHHGCIRELWNKLFCREPGYDRLVELYTKGCRHGESGNLVGRCEKWRDTSFLNKKRPEFFRIVVEGLDGVAVGTKKGGYLGFLLLEGFGTKDNDGLGKAFLPGRIADQHFGSFSDGDRGQRFRECCRLHRIRRAASACE